MMASNSSAVIMEDIAYDLGYEQQDDVKTWLHESITDLSKDGCLIKWIQNEQNANLYKKIQQKLMTIRHYDNDIVSTKSRYAYCCIRIAKDFNRISTNEKITYTTDYKLFIHHQSELYYLVFTGKYSKIKLLHKIAINDAIYFPSTKATAHAFPDCM